jgi:hypothetical protein
MNWEHSAKVLPKYSMNGGQPSAGRWNRTDRSEGLSGCPPMAELFLRLIGRLFIELIEALCAWAAKNDDALSKLRRRRKEEYGFERQSGEGSIISVTTNRGTSCRLAGLVPTNALMVIDCRQPENYPETGI